ncbi:MAG TPA: hypothetical protein VGG33_08075, partial [Polyangia bacterium]
NALALDGLATGAAFGVSSFFTPRASVQAAAMLGAGTAGLVLGGALHDAIALDRNDGVLLTTAGAGGLWYGGFLPFAFSDDPNERERRGALLAGLFGATTVATALTPALDVDPGEAASIGLGGALGAAVAGGTALIADDLHGSAGYRLMLAGTTAGVVTGALFAPQLRLLDQRLTNAVVGATLGAGEALIFTWAGRADGAHDYAGAGLIGASVGATLGLATETSSETGSGGVLPRAGFAAWGAWVGAFGGALFNRDSHEVTFGGLAGADLGFLAGHLLLGSEVIEARDFGWLSVFGVAGTVLGGGAGAIFSSRSDPQPVLAGLAVGPAVGMAIGALTLSRLRAARGPASTSPPEAEGTADVTTEATAHTLGPSGRFRRRLREAIDITSWTPMVGALPEPGGGTAPGPAPLFVGVSGFFR